MKNSNERKKALNINSLKKLLEVFKKVFEVILKTSETFFRDLLNKQNGDIHFDTF